jgi:hypothetical protein
MVHMTELSEARLKEGELIVAEANEYTDDLIEQAQKAGDHFRLRQVMSEGYTHAQLQSVQVAASLVGSFLAGEWAKVDHDLRVMYAGSPQRTQFLEQHRRVVQDEGYLAWAEQVADARLAVTLNPMLGQVVHPIGLQAIAGLLQLLTEAIELLKHYGCKDPWLFVRTWQEVKRPFVSFPDAPAGGHWPGQHLHEEGCLYPEEGGTLERED